jgi:large subunit ribosomal protein L35
MPKVKTKSGAKKRFKVTGKIKRKRAFKNHILTKKTTKQKRRLTKKAIVNKRDESNIKPMLPYLL